ncbi:hypothetical protein ZWY2020_008434 [Hordeum vulgare]|nr:hypothetical protein ZWY2020_008434 [Hordeum vulgare]
MVLRQVLLHLPPPLHPQVDALPASVSDASAPASNAWRCPGCQSVQDVRARDIAYTCFCCRRRDPPNDLFLTCTPAASPAPSPPFQHFVMISYQFKHLGCLVA